MSKEIMENMIPTGLLPLDEIMKGWHLSDLIVISSRWRRGGRTILAMTIARNLTIDYHIPVAYFSLKLSNVQFVNRLLAMESGCALSELNNYKEDQELAKRIDAAVDKLKDIPLYVDDTPDLSIFDFKSKLKELVEKHGIKLAIIDFVQLMRGHEDAGCWDQALEKIIEELKDAASEYGVAIIVLDKMGWAVDDVRDAKKVPGAEKYADVLLVYHPNESKRWEDIECGAKIYVMKNNRGKFGDCVVKVKKWRIDYDSSRNNDGMV